MAFIWPNSVKVVTQDFGPSPISVEPTRYFDKDAGGFLRCAKTTFPGADGSNVNFHAGLDCRAAEGSGLLAIAAGKVTAHPSYVNSIGTNYGITVLATPRCRFTYWHVQAAGRVPVGTNVTQSTVIAKAGHTGTVATHLHLQLEIKDPDGVWREYNPERFLPAHKKSNGAAVPSGDLIHVPVATLLIGNVTPSVPTCNVRAQASTNAAILGTLTAGAKRSYDRIIDAQVISGNPHWYEVEWSPFIWGYISATVAKPA